MIISTSFEMNRSFVKLPYECGHILPYKNRRAEGRVIPDNVSLSYRMSVFVKV